MGTHHTAKPKGGASGVRMRWVAMFTILLMITSAVPVFGEEVGEGTPESPGFTPPTSKEEEIAAAQVPDARDVSEALGEYEKEEKEREEWLSTPQAEEQRESSRLAFSSLSPGESEELLRSAFSEQLEALNSDPSRFLSEAQLVEPLGESGAVVSDEGEASLLETNIPLQTEDEDGQLAKVDLSLEASPEGFETENAVSDLVLPNSADEAIEVGQEGFEITQTGAADSSASRFGDKNLFYPSVLPDTDMLAAGNSLGVELFDQLRSEESPENLSFDIGLPEGAELRSDGRGGAEVAREGEQLMLIPKPTATDAQGTEVPVTLEVVENSIALHVDHRTGEYGYPILVDPIVEDWVNQGNNWYGGANWGALSNGAWQWTSNNSNIHHEICCWEGSHAGLLTIVEPVFYGPEQYGHWSYSTANSHVLIPHIWLIPFNRADMGCGSAQPHDYVGIWSVSLGWSPLLVNYAKTYGNVSADGRGEALILGESTGPPGVWLGCQRILYAGGVGIWLEDEDLPELSTAATKQWMDKAPVRLSVSAMDPGVGVKSFEAWATNSSGNKATWTTTKSCTGLYGARCPQTWNLGEGSQPALSYDPSVLPEGIDKLSVKAYDATGKPSTTTNVMTVRVDHAPPAISLKGTVTEQAKLGTELPSYTLTATATDGVPNSEKDADARSGVTKLTFQENGKYVVTPWEESCPSQSCPIEEEIEIPAYKLPAGSHTVVVKATDALGHVATKEITFTTGDKQSPNVTLSGMPSEASGATYANYWSSFGSSGTSGGQFSHPAGAAVDSKGNLWVVDENNKRIEKFNEAGEYVSSFGSSGTGNGQFSRPTDIAVDPKGNLWVTDAGGNRVEEFNEKGEYLTKFGTYGSGNGQFNAAESVAIDSKGNIWVSDTYNGRLEEFNEKGEFVKVVGSKGTGQGQMIEPTGIAIGPGNNVWVADWSNNRVTVFNESGGFVRQFGTSGSANGQFSHPDVIEVDAQGDVWVGDQGNNRVQEFNQSGEYVTKFGASGSGKGQFSFGWPMGIAADSKGTLWVSDTGNNRVERWLAPNVTFTGQLDPITAATTDTGFGVTSVTAKVTNEAGTAEVLGETTQSCAKGQCSLSLNLPEPDLSEKPAGAYMLTFSATDGAGNMRRVNKVIGLDPTPPTIALSGTLAERANKPLNAPSGVLTIKASDPAGSGVKTINVERDHRRVASYPYSCASNCGEVTASYRYSAARDGTERVIQKAADPSGATLTSLGGVSCVSASSCTAVGYYKNSAGTTVSLAERWDGTEWKVQATPNPAGALESRLEGVSCSTASNCSAVGYYKSGSESFATLVERWTGSEWVIVSSPNPSGVPKAYLYGVSCTAANDCWAVGKSSYKFTEELEGKKPVALAEHWNGSAWTISSVSEPPAQLKHVSCATSSSCVAVTSLEGLGLERWNGSSWSPQSVAAPSGGSGSTMSGVSCSAASECTAVGSYTIAGHVAPLVERWNGSSWAFQASVDPKGVIEEEGAQVIPPAGKLEGVSCKSSTSCTAFGSYRNAVLKTQPLAESWDGTEWALQPAPTPAESSNASTSDVSCFNSFECVAVGSNVQLSTHALIENQAPSKDSHRISVEAIDKYGATAVQAIDVDVPDETLETPDCSQETTSVAPKGAVTPGEAISAIEKSSLPEAVAASIPTTEELTEDEISPSYTPPQPNLDSTGNLAEGETSVAPDGGVTLAGIACITPSSVTTAATQATVAHGDAAVFANTAPETSTVVRPTSGGISLIQAVNGPNAPGSFSWNVTVPVGTELEKLPSGAIAIVKATEEKSEGVAELPEPQDVQSPEALNNAATQLETEEYQLASAQAETNHEVIAIIAEPWIVLRRERIIPVPIEIAPIEEIPTEYVIHVIMPADEEQAAFFPVYLRLDATASASVNGYCADQSPCGDFDSLAGTLYATFWGNPVHDGARNPHYHDYGADNCTNFLSQILRDGNVKFMRAFDHGDGSWWYHNNFKNGQYADPEGYGWDTTESWRLADKLPRHLWQYGLAHIDPVQDPWGWTRGDILAEDWYGTNGKGDFNHLQFVVGTNNSAGHSREPLIANESSPGHNYSSLIWWRVRERIQYDQASSGWTRVAIAMKHTKANLNDKKHDPDNLYGPGGLFNG
jgi:sugar lactone lactonase YvrE